MKFVDVQNDVAFHKIFGNPDKTEALISFLNAVLYPDGEDLVVRVEVQHPFLFPPVPIGKTSIIDVEATDKKGRMFLVELQVADRQGFETRSYLYDLIAASRIARGSDQILPRPACLICILDFNYTPGLPYFSMRQNLGTEKNENLLQDAKYFFIELEKFQLEEVELVSALDKWTYFIKNAHNLDAAPSNVEDIGLRAAYLDADQKSWTKAEWRAYDNFYIYLTDLAMRALAAQRNRMKEGLEEGLEEGMKKGLEEGLEKGKREREAQLVLSMHAAGLAMPQISAIAGISEADVEAIISGAKG